MSLATALAGIYGAKEILRFISRVYPELGSKIRNAQEWGNSSEDILRFINRMDKGHFSHPKRSEFTNPYLEAEDLTKKVHPAGKILMNAASIGLGAYGAARGLSALAGTTIGQNLLNKIGLPTSAPPSAPSQIATSPVPTKGPQPMANAPVQPPMEGLPQQQAASPSQNQQPQAVNPASILKSMNLHKQIENLRKAGNAPPVIADAINAILKPGQRKWLEDQIKAGQAKPMQDMVTEYLSQPREAEFGPKEEEIGEEVVPERKKEKGSIVSTPDGDLGSVKSQRNGKSLIEVDGKLKQVETDSLIDSPVSEEELADLHDELVKGIERHSGQPSRNVSWAGYDPMNNELAYLPHDGSFYIYKDIPKEEVDLLTSMLVNRKTSGENFIGAWEKDTKSPIGAAMSALIKRLQAFHGGKGKEYVRKYASVYNFLEPAIKASKKRKKNEKRISS